ncbi:DUF4148 domain-containing protein [Paraburkholderia sp. BCC1886]|uniref:DUF4148 domain-containing protein n=1 Tax=Paraburkholderia sp. BCC1886 TaxID=2562670 RepID=UPI0011843B45|nr:DUF4148 domain-containing protein [Paraburkholderia sp. BCC1886]
MHGLGRQAVRRVLAVALCCAGLPGALTQAAHAASLPAATGKSRATVDAELCRAEQAGLVPATNLGPPDAWTIARNQASFAATGFHCPAAPHKGDTVR